jgi:hypothetical protein
MTATYDRVPLVRGTSSRQSQLSFHGIIMPRIGSARPQHLAEAAPHAAPGWLNDAETRSY